MTTILVLLVVVLLLAGLATVVLFRRPRVVPPVITEPRRTGDDGAARKRAAERLGTELLERRIELDGRRGPLQGDSGLDLHLAELEQQRRDGRISDEEFEAEKIRLLTG